MEVPTYLLFLLGLLGAADIALFHTVSHGIRQHQDSVGELITHALRGPTYATLFLLTPNFVLEGWWFLLLAGILVFDLGISIVDFWLEGDSRRRLGGLPAGEYVLHILLAMLFGGFVVAVGYGAGHWFHAPTALRYAPAAVPDLLRLVMGVMAVAVLYSGIQDGRAALRLQRQRTQHAAAPPPERAG